MKKNLLFGCLMLWCLVGRAATLRVGPGGTFSTIHQAVDAAAPHDTIVVQQGRYAEGTLVLEKPLVLIGEGFPLLDGESKGEVITVKASDISIIGFDIRNTGQLSTIDLAGIKVLAASRIWIENNILHNCNFGIYLSNTDSCTVLCNRVYGTPGAEQNTGNGIHLWKCSHAWLEDNYLSSNRDGIYFEFVTESVIQGNRSEHNIRYGLHFMFSHSNLYRFNIFFENGAGVAVMYSKNVHMYYNQFLHNWGSAAYGILLKEISDSHIAYNVFQENTAGVYMEGTSRIRFEHNIFRTNGWALRVQASCNDNEVHDNSFFGNSFDVATNGDVMLNNFDRNYWDKYEGYDLNHDGTGDIPYRPVSLYAVVVEKMPPGLILMRSFMVYLLDKAEKIVPSLTPELLLDKAPAMKPVNS